MKNVSFPIRPQVARDPDGRITIYVGGSYQTMEVEVAMAMHGAMGEVLASSGSRILTCVYCGQEYPQGTPAAGDAVLTDHIRGCARHPMRAAERTIGRLRRALEGLVGTSSPELLKRMEIELRQLPGAEEDKAASINAIRALLAEHA